jgi:hypothetical protein
MFPWPEFNTGHLKASFERDFMNGEDSGTSAFKHLVFSLALNPGFNTRHVS